MGKVEIFSTNVNNIPVCRGWLALLLVKEFVNE